RRFLNQPDLWHCMRFSRSIQSLRSLTASSSSSADSTAWRRLFDEAFGDNRPPALALSSQELADYLPRGFADYDGSMNSGEDLSIPYSIVRTGEQESEIKRLPLLGADAQAGLAFAGGRIRCLTWLPPDPSLGPAQPQLLLVCPDWPELEADTDEQIRRRRHHGTVQIWRVGPDGDELSISACLCHEFGPIVACAWLPSPPPSTADISRQQHRTRPIYIALACASDGLIRVAQLPTIERLISAGKSSTTTQTQPAPIAEPLGPFLSLGLASLVTPSDSSTGSDEDSSSQLLRYGRPICLEVQSDCQPGLVLAGFSSGLCAAWHLDCVQFRDRGSADVQGLRYSPKLAYLNASRIWLASPSRAPVLAMRLEPESGDTLAVSCADRRVRLFSLSQLTGTQPAQLLRLPRHSMASLDETTQSAWRLAHSCLRDGLAMARLGGQIRVIQLPPALLHHCRRGQRRNPMQAVHRATPTRPWLAASLIQQASPAASAKAASCRRCSTSGARCYTCVRATHRLLLSLPPLSTNRQAKLPPLAELEQPQLYPMHLAQCLEWSRSPSQSNWLAVGFNCGLIRLARVEHLDDAPAYGPLVDAYYEINTELFDKCLAEIVELAQAKSSPAKTSVERRGRPRRKIKPNEKKQKKPPPPKMPTTTTTTTGTSKRRGRPPKHRPPSSPPIIKERQQQQQQQNPTEASQASSSLTLIENSVGKAKGRISQSLLALANIPAPMITVLSASSSTSISAALASRELSPPSIRANSKLAATETTGKTSSSNVAKSTTSTNSIFKQSTSSSVEKSKSNVGTLTSSYFKKSAPSCVEKSTPSNVEKSTPSNVEKSTPSNVEKSTPSNVEKSTPSNVEKSTPSNVEKSTPSNVEKSTPSNVEKSTPSNVEKSTPSNVEKSTSSSVKKSTSSSVEKSTPSDLEKPKTNVETSTSVVGKSTPSRVGTSTLSSSVDKTVSYVVRLSSPSASSSTSTTSAKVMSSASPTFERQAATKVSTVAPSTVSASVSSKIRVSIVDLSSSVAAVSPSTISKAPAKSSTVVALSPSTISKTPIESSNVDASSISSASQLPTDADKSTVAKQSERQESTPAARKPGRKRKQPQSADAEADAGAAASARKRRASRKISTSTAFSRVGGSGGVFKYSAEQMAQMLDRIRQFEQNPESLFVELEGDSAAGSGTAAG
uniref:ANAPC4_WD40 domain-containing protein n=1 Tax=Macrostomum lignano TaxID=282301 RepID=A0A1I8G936_9PLAT